MNLLYDIVSEVADREGVDPVDLDTSLNDVVDVEALEALVAATARTDCQSPTVEFQYAGYTVSVDGPGAVHVTDRSDATEGSWGTQSDTPVESVSAVLAHREDALTAVNHIVAARERPFEERLDGLLEAVRETLDVESATLSYVSGDNYVFEAVDVAPDVETQAGDVVSLPETACKRVVETEQALVLRDVDAEAPVLADSALDVSSYIGVPVFVDGSVYGTFCFYDTDARTEEYSEWDLALVELLSEWVGSELERRQRDREVHASRTERPYAAD